MDGKKVPAGVPKIVFKDWDQPQWWTLLRCSALSGLCCAPQAGATWEAQVRSQFHLKAGQWVSLYAQQLSEDEAEDHKLKLARHHSKTLSTGAGCGGWGLSAQVGG